ncbi:MAG TPA: hypothetical protein VMW46_00115 [Candidatus Desulfaltia sp.]|nr:hypothetical protein [Candidatus Desulfaltia sp.]
MLIPQRHRRRVRLAFLLLVFLVRCAFPGSPVESPDAFQQVKRLGRGVNILGYDPIWENFAEGRFKERHFKLIHEAGLHRLRYRPRPLGGTDPRSPHS